MRISERSQAARGPQGEQRKAAAQDTVSGINCTGAVVQGLPMGCERAEVQRDSDGDDEASFNVPEHRVDRLLEKRHVRRRLLCSSESCGVGSSLCCTVLRFHVLHTRGWQITIYRLTIVNNHI